MDEKDELTAVLTMVADSMPPSCCNGDVTSVRRALAHERIRIKKIQLKEQQAAELLAAAPIVPSAVEGDTGDKSVVVAIPLDDSREGFETAAPATLKTAPFKAATQIARVPSTSSLTASGIASSLSATPKAQSKSKPSSPVKRPPPATAPSSPILSSSSFIPSSSLLMVGDVAEGGLGKTAGSSPLKTKRVKKANQKYVEKDESASAVPTPRKSPASKHTVVITANDVGNGAEQSATVPVQVAGGMTTVALDGLMAPSESEVNAAKKKRIPKPKPLWVPCEEVLLALEQFGTFYRQTGIKLAKSSSVPLNLEDSLYLLHRIVCAHHGDTLHGTSGYLEAVHAILGGEVAAGKIKAVFSRCTAQDKAKAAREALDMMTAQLCTALNALVGPCPEAMQPANKAKAAAIKSSSAAVTVTSARSDLSAAAAENEVSAVASAESVPMAVCEETRYVQTDPFAVVEHIVSPLEDTRSDSQTESASNTQQSVVGHSQGSSSSSSFATSAVPVAGEEPLVSVIESTAQLASSPPPPPLVVFSWYCKWNVATRGQLLGVVQAVTDWVALENVYRSKLTEIHKRLLERGQVRVIDANNLFYLIFDALVSTSG
jgi:hypothetical protein